MLDQNDLQQIRGIVREEVGIIVRDDVGLMIQKSEERIILQVGEMLEQNVLPQLDHLSKEMCDVKSYLTKWGTFAPKWQ
mgnify:CR=1 FL=1